MTYNKIFDFKAITFFLILYLLVIIYLWGGVHDLLVYFVGLCIFFIITYLIGTIYGKFTKKFFAEQRKLFEKFDYPQEDFHTKLPELELMSFIGTSGLLFAYIMRHLGHLEYAATCAGIGTSIAILGLVLIVGSYAKYQQYKDI